MHVYIYIYIYVYYMYVYIHVLHVCIQSATLAVSSRGLAARRRRVRELLRRKPGLGAVWTNTIL